MSQFTPQNADFEAVVRESFGRQQVMRTIGASMARVIPGEVMITLPFRSDLTQQHGFVHAGIVTTIVDSAAGYSALSLMPSDVGVLSVEYKVNFVAPAAGALFVAVGRVLKPGRTLMVCSGEVYALSVGETANVLITAGDLSELCQTGKLVVTMLATMMVMQDRQGIVG
ncbi:MAG: PaaI family thioesterase [Ktedonobacterales bacterium]